MSTPSAAVRAGIITTAIAVAGGLAVGILTRHTTQDAQRTWVDFGDGGPPADVRCVLVSGLAQPPVLKLFGLQYDAGAQYAQVRVCGSPVELDGGAMPALPSGMYGIVDTEEEVPWDAGFPRMEAWTGTAAPFQCACSSGAGCQAPNQTPGGDGGLETAPEGATLQPGWVGAGCIPKTCVEVAGVSSWPAGCPQ